MDIQKTTHKALDLLKEKGAQSASIFTTDSYFDELVYENDNFTLLRSVNEASANLSAIVDQKLGDYSANQLADDALEAACDKTIEIANSGKQDDAFEFAPHYEAKSFEHGPMKADKDKMKEMIEDFVSRASKKYPEIGLRSITVKYNHAHTYFANSHGSSSDIRKGYYSFGAMFNAQDESTSSSMNYDGLDFNDFDVDLLSEQKFGKIFSDTIKHLNAKKIDSTFKGNAIVTPQCLNTFLSFILSHISTQTLISGTSRLHEKIGQKVASDLFTLKSLPQSDVFANPNFLTSDGVETQDITIFEKGELKNYLLGIYGKNKMGADKVSNFASRLYMPKGEDSLESMIQGIDQGIIIGRFSGGMPNSNGDFSGIAKNSFLIKDGKVDQALSETMISGNLFDLIESAYGTSEEVYENGTCHLPYLATKNITVS